MLHMVYESWWTPESRNTSHAKSVLRLGSIRTISDKPFRVYLQWYRLTYMVYRVRKLRRTIAHGFAYLHRWKDLKWGNTKRPAVAYRRTNVAGVATNGAAEQHRNADIEAADPEFDPADVIDAAGDQATGTLVHAWCSLTSLCLSVVAVRTLPFLYFIVMMVWGLAKAFLGYVLHVVVVGLLETTYVRRMVMTVSAAIMLKIAYWLGLLPSNVNDLSWTLQALPSPMRLLT